MTSRMLAVASSLLALVLTSCAAADAIGEWNGDLALTGSTGSPPGSIAGNYAVSASVIAKPSGDCGITVDVTEVGTWELDDGVACADGGFDVTLGAEENTVLTVTEVDEVHLTGTAANQLTLVLSGDAPDWTCTFEGSASHSL